MHSSHSDRPARLKPARKRSENVQLAPMPGKASEKDGRPGAGGYS